MLTILPIRTIARCLGYAYIISVIGCGLILRPEVSNWDPAYLLKVGSGVLSAFTLLIGFTASIGWRLLWRCFPYFRGLYPDLTGTWDVSIEWIRQGESGTVVATAIIKQNLLRFSMEVEAPASDSRTLSAVPKKDPESGRAALHYIYLVTPHAKLGKASASYHGAAILTLSDDGAPKIAGNYWTSHQSDGRLIMARRPTSVTRG